MLEQRKLYVNPLNAVVLLPELEHLHYKSETLAQRKHKNDWSEEFCSADCEAADLAVLEMETCCHGFKLQHIVTDQQLLEWR